MPMVLFMAGLARVGPSTASIASTVEPPVTVALAWIVFGETLGPLQLVGGAFVLSAVVLLQLRRSVVRDQLDVERGGERPRQLEDVAPAHPRAA
jgi:drug/metabolite transporter (DMT)-like permease